MFAMQSGIDHKTKYKPLLFFLVLKYVLWIENSKCFLTPYNLPAACIYR